MRIRRFGLWFVGLLVVGFLLYTGVAQVGVNMEERSSMRDASGIRIGAEERTLGPESALGAVLFVHGFVGGSNNFEQMPDLLAQRGWRVRVMRLPGHGTSPRDFARQAPGDLIAAVRKEADALKQRYAKLVLVGHSMGGALSTIVASEVQPSGLVLAAPYFGITHHWYYGLPLETWTQLLAPVVPYVYKGQFFIQVNRKEAKPQIFSYTWMPSKGLLTLLAVGRRAREPELLAKIHCPVLWLHSKTDSAASPDAAQAAVDAMASTHKETVWLGRTSHHVFWDYDREQVQKSIIAFVESLP